MKHFNLVVFAFFAAIMIWVYLASKKANPVFLPQPSGPVPEKPFSR